MVGTTAVEQVTKPHVKAGIIVVERNLDNPSRPYFNVIAPWSSRHLGKQTDGVKGYDFPKGDVDGDEGDLTAAMREFREETGINLQRLLHTQGGYEGVEVTSEERRRWRDKPFIKSTCPTLKGGSVKMVFYKIEVEGLHNLWRHFKQNKGKSEKECCPAGELDTDISLPKSFQGGALRDADSDNLPDFETVKHIMLTGLLPQSWEGVWGSGANKKEIFQMAEEDSSLNDKIVDLLGKTKDQDKYNTAIKKLYSDANNGNHIGGREIIPELQRRAKALSKWLSDAGLTSDERGPKVDKLDIPGRFYAEGADVIPFAWWGARMEHLAKDNSYYARLMFNRNYKEEEQVVEGESYAELLLRMHDKLNKQFPYKYTSINLDALNDNRATHENTLSEPSLEPVGETNAIPEKEPYKWAANLEGNVKIHKGPGLKKVDFTHCGAVLPPELRASIKHKVDEVSNKTAERLVA